MRPAACIPGRSTPMEPGTCAGWDFLPLPAWEAVADSLAVEDIKLARLVCRQWAKDLGANVKHATVLPVQLAAAAHQWQQRRSAAGNANGSNCAVVNSATGCSQLHGAFPFMKVAHLDLSTMDARALAGDALASLVSKRKAQDFEFHMHAEAGVPQAVGGLPFRELLALTRGVSPAVLGHIAALHIDCYPDQRRDWRELVALPALSKLKLSAVIGYRHVPHIARVQQLQDLDIIIQGSYRNWPASRDAFDSLGALTALTSLKVEATRCCSEALSNAVWQMKDLRKLTLGGWVELAPAHRLTELARLQELDITQDLQVSELEHIMSSITSLSSVRAGTPLPAKRCPWHGAPISATAFARFMRASFIWLGLMTEQEALDAAASDGDGHDALSISQADQQAGADMVYTPKTDGDLQASKRFCHEVLIRLNKLQAGMDTKGADYLDFYETCICGPRLKHASNGMLLTPTEVAQLQSMPKPLVTVAHGSMAKLELSLSGVEDLEKISILPGLCRVRHLTLGIRNNSALQNTLYIMLHGPQALQLGTFTELRQLTLSGQFTAAPSFLLPLLLHLPHVQQLSINAHFVLDWQVSQALSQLTALQVLAIQHRGRDKLVINVMGLPSSLGVLKLENCQLAMEPTSSCKNHDQHPPMMGRLPLSKLQTLHLVGCLVQAAVIEAVANSAIQLQELNVHKAILDRDATFELWVQALPHLTTIKELRLLTPPERNLRTAELRGSLLSLPRLSTLELHFGIMEPAAILCVVQGLTHLTRLDVMVYAEATAAKALSSALAVAFSEGCTVQVSHYWPKQTKRHTARPSSEPFDVLDRVNITLHAALFIYGVVDLVRFIVSRARK